MKRLTFEGDFCDIALCREVRGGSFCEDGACSQRRVWERLKAYEDTGMEPEAVEHLKIASMGKAVAEIKEFEGIPTDRFRELAQADKEGRCVVLPCPNCLDIVFGEQEIFWGIDTDYEEYPIREITVRNEERITWYDGWRTVVLKGEDENGLDFEFSPDEIGKTVFLTREEAETKMREEKEGAASCPTECLRKY